MIKLFHYAKDGGRESTVWGYWLIEWKRFFSIALLCFEDGSREAYHSHAFNSVSWLLKGRLIENTLKENGDFDALNVYPPSFVPIVTRRDTLHKVVSYGRSWVLTFRGPWAKTWREWLPAQERFVTLTHGRIEVHE